MNSLRRRLGLGLIAVLVLVALVLVQSSLWLFESALRRTLAEDLQTEADALVAAIVPGPAGLRLDGQRLSPRYERAFSGHYFRIELPGRVWRSRSLWDASPAWPQAPGLADALIDGPQTQRLLSFTADYRRGGEAIRIQVAQDYTPILQSFDRVRLVGLAVVGLAVLALLLLQRYLIRVALRPLEQARQQIAQLQSGQRQTLEPAAVAELQPLVTQINRLLAETEATLARSRHALGDLGHALKTPLAVLTSLLRRPELETLPELRAALAEQLGQIEGRVARELGRARLAGEALPSRFFDCEQELPALFDTLAAIHPRGLQLSWQAPPGCRLPWDREDLLELLGNLLDNACKWARSEVRLNIATGPDGYRLTLDDDGPGIDPSQREEVLARGARLDERQDGHGLGLGIVRDILVAWRADWALQDSPLGGLRVVVELPHTPTPVPTERPA